MAKAKKQDINKHLYKKYAPNKSGDYKKKSLLNNMLAYK